MEPSRPRALVRAHAARDNPRLLPLPAARCRRTCGGSRMHLDTGNTGFMLLWWAFGFSMCFSGNLESGTDVAGIVGNFDWVFLRGITLDMPSPINDSIPMIVFVAYQMMFAIITPALITGAFANRVTFKAYM